MSKIVIASILKTVHDVRMYEKFALTLTNSPQNEIHIIGFKSRIQNIYNPLIYFYPVYDFKRLSIKRFFSNVVFLKLLFNIRPQILVVCTHELLIASVIYKVLFSTKIVYDVQENYFKNILYSNSFTSFLKYPLAYWVLAKEFILSFFITKFILAETCYLDELTSFVKKEKAIVIENKYAGEVCSKPPFKIKKGFKLIYTGTIAQIYGIEEAIHLATILNTRDNNVSLEIIGHSPDSNYLSKIMRLLKNKPFINLFGGYFSVPHKQIIAAINNADIALISYRKNESTKDKIPTKLYECLALSKPMMIDTYAINWLDLMSDTNAAIAINYMDTNADKLYNEVLIHTFYTSLPNEKIYKWQKDELFKLFETLG